MGNDIECWLERVGTLFYEHRRDSQKTGDGEDNPAAAVNKTNRWLTNGLHEQERCGTNQTQDRQTQHVHGSGEVDIVLKAAADDEIYLANTEHNHQTGNDNRRRRQQTAPDIARGGITDVGGTVDADRPWGDLANSQDVHKLLLCHPAILLYLVLDERENRQSTAETEETNLEETEK